MKLSCLTAKTAWLGRLFQRKLVEQVKHREIWCVLYLVKRKVSSLCWAVCRVIGIGFANWGTLELSGWSKLCQTLSNIDKHSTFLRFLVLSRCPEERIECY